MENSTSHRRLQSEVIMEIALKQPPTDFKYSRQETLVLDLLPSGHVITLDEIVAKLPELSWVQVFIAVDGLSRRGEVVLHRRNFAYEVFRQDSRPPQDR